MSSKALRKLLAKVVKLAKKHGVESEEVKSFVIAHEKEEPELKILSAAILVLMNQDED